MAAIIAFSTSLVLLVAFLSFKVFEQARTLVGYQAVRVRADRFVRRVAAVVRTRLARVEEHLSLNSLAQQLVRRTASVIAAMARTVEVYAEDVTRRMSRNGNGVARTTKSLFLEEVATHKSNLDTERVKRETSL